MPDISGYIRERVKMSTTNLIFEVYCMLAAPRSLQTGTAGYVIHPKNGLLGAWTEAWSVIFQPMLLSVMPVSVVKCLWCYEDRLLLFCDRWQTSLHIVTPPFNSQVVYETDLAFFVSCEGGTSTSRELHRAHECVQAESHSSERLQSDKCENAWQWPTMISSVQCG